MFNEPIDQRRVERAKEYIDPVTALGYTGKFEGETVEVPYYWSLVGDGAWDHSFETIDGEGFVFRVSKDEASTFGITDPYFAVWSLTDGFVTGQEIGEDGFLELGREEETYLSELAE